MIGPAIRYVFSFPSASALTAAKAAVATGAVWGVSVTGAECRTTTAVIKGETVYLAAIALPLSTVARRTRAKAFDAAIQRPTRMVEMVPAGEDVWAAPGLEMRQAVLTGLAADSAPITAP